MWHWHLTSHGESFVCAVQDPTIHKTPVIGPSLNVITARVVILTTNDSTFNQHRQSCQKTSCNKDLQNKYKHLTVCLTAQRAAQNKTEKNPSRAGTTQQKASHGLWRCPLRSRRASLCPPHTPIQLEGPDQCFCRHHSHLNKRTAAGLADEILFVNMRDQVLQSCALIPAKFSFSGSTSFLTIRVLIEPLLR